MELSADKSLEIQIKVESKGYWKKIRGTASELGVVGWSYPQDSSPEDWYWNENSEQLEAFYSECFEEFIGEVGSYEEWNDYEWEVKVID